jgi:hypothetical protein
VGELCGYLSPFWESRPRYGHVLAHEILVIDDLPHLRLYEIVGRASSGDTTGSLRLYRRCTASELNLYQPPTA